MIEAILGVAVVLVAGYFIAMHRDRIRQLGTAVTLGVAAGSALPDLSSDSDSGSDDEHGSHPEESHWDGADAGGPHSL